MRPPTISIDQLITVVTQGGTVKTGIDVYDKKGRLLLQKDVPITDANILLSVKKAGVTKIPIIAGEQGGLWDSQGRQIPLPKPSPPKSAPAPAPPPRESSVSKRLNEIQELKKEAGEKYQQARKILKKSMDDIKKNDGFFEVEEIKETVNDLFNFLVKNDTAFSFLTKEIISYDDYLYNHSINVCTIGTTILNKFKETINKLDKQALVQNGLDASHLGFLAHDFRDIPLGYFLHDVGKTIIPESILNKNGPLTDEEFEVIKNHSFVHGTKLLDKNMVSNPFTRDAAFYHHCRLYEDEGRCYPAQIMPDEVPLYVKICKLADIYDAMTAKRAYKDAMNPTSVVNIIFRNYAGKKKTLQIILHAFVKAVGIYPPGSIVTFENGQLAYVIDSDGPIALPFTDTSGNALKTHPDPIDISIASTVDKNVAIDHSKPLVDPIKVYNLLPEVVRNTP